MDVAPLKLQINSVNLRNLIRLIFPALVDADFLDAEAHYQVRMRRNVAFDPQRMLAQLLDDIGAFCRL